MLVVVRAVLRVAMPAVDEILVIVVDDELVAAAGDVDMHVCFVRQVPG